MNAAKFSKVINTNVFTEDQRYYHAQRFPLEQKAQRIIQKEIAKIQRKAVSIAELDSALETYKNTLKEKGYFIKYKYYGYFFSDKEEVVSVTDVTTDHFVRRDVIRDTSYTYKASKGWNIKYSGWVEGVETKYFNFYLGKKEYLSVSISGERNSYFDFNVVIETTLKS